MEDLCHLKRIIYFFADGAKHYLVIFSRQTLNFFSEMHFIISPTILSWY
jgi:hypothetical protein